jgi:phenylalanyl-tRNA synthetase beta chain
MKVSYNWLQDYINLNESPEKIEELLTLAGLEVDDVEQFGNQLDGVVVGKVLSVREHPNADRLYLCDVDIGDEQVQIVCGADNVGEGQLVPVATVGTELPVQDEEGNNFVIKEAKLRGEESRGMICAEDE